MPKEQPGYCRMCNRQVLGQKETPNHVLHFLVTCFTCGLWGVVWAILTLAMGSGPFRCPTCGTAVGSEWTGPYRPQMDAAGSGNLASDGSNFTSLGLSDTDREWRAPQVAPILYPCPACGRQVSNQGASCPGCAHPLKQ